MPKGKLGGETGAATGHNNPRKTTEITTGSSKKRNKNYGHSGQQERSGKPAQDAKVHPMREGLSKLPHEADSRAQEAEGEKRSGSESNAHKHRISIA
jgi:hypothetical protein